MRILSMVSSFYPYRGGSGLGHYDLLSRLVKKYGHEVDILTYNYGNTGKTEQSIISGMTVYRLSCWARDDFVTIPRLSFANILMFIRLAKRNYDVIYTRSRYSPPTLIGALLAMCRGIPHLHTEVAPPLPYRRHWYSGMFANVMDKTVGKWILNHTYCVAVSLSAYNSMHYAGAKKLWLIYNGVDRELFHAKDS